VPKVSTFVNYCSNGNRGGWGGIETKSSDLKKKGAKKQRPDRTLLETEPGRVEVGAKTNADKPGREL